MEAYNAEKAAKVWQRVLGEAPSGTEQWGMQQLIMDAFTEAATYSSLSRRFQGKPAAAFRQLAEEKQKQAACLRGICILAEGTCPAAKNAPLPHGTTEAVLRRCYGQECRCIAEYERRSSDPEYGPVYARLAAQERELCCQLLALLGGLQK